MQTSRCIRFIMLALCLASLLAFGIACAPANSSNLKVVTTTSLISTIVNGVGGDKVEAANLIPPLSHPGSFDVKPSDIQTLSKANLFLMHGWPGETFTQALIASANNPNLVVSVIDIKGNWMVPQFQAEAVDKITSTLGGINPQNKSYYEEKAGALKKSITAKGNEFKAKLDAERVSQVKVLCSDPQVGFLQWTGFDIIASYGGVGGPEALTTQKLQELVTKGREAGIALVIDNLQSAPDAGKGIAQEMGAVQVNLSNFPGGFDNTETWEKAVQKNIDLLLQAVAKYRGK